MQDWLEQMAEDIRATLDVKWEKIFRESLMEVYKIRHVETGLFYGPLREKRGNGRRGKTNISTNGKIYSKRPSLENCRTYWHPQDVLDKAKRYSRQPLRRSSPGDWEIVEYELKEIC